MKIKLTAHHYAHTVCTVKQIDVISTFIGLAKLGLRTNCWFSPLKGTRIPFTRKQSLLLVNTLMVLAPRIADFSLPYFYVGTPS
jgi:hypothetical protein